MTGHPQSYWIANVDIADPAAFERCRRATTTAFARFGARFPVRGGATLVIGFPSCEAARACCDSPEHQVANALRDPASAADLMFAEGRED
jgi:uncharacterized protein (DUF1330 family)